MATATVEVDYRFHRLERLRDCDVGSKRTGNKYSDDVVKVSDRESREYSFSRHLRRKRIINNPFAFVLLLTLECFLEITYEFTIKFQLIIGDEFILAKFEYVGIIIDCTIYN